MQKASLKTFLKLFVIIAIGFFLKKLIESFNLIVQMEWFYNPWFLFLHIITVAVFFISLLFGWNYALKISGQNLSLASTSYSWLIANVGKYTPAKVLMIAGRLSLCAKIGVRRAVCSWAIVIEHFFTLLATLPFVLAVVLQGYKPGSVFIFAFGLVIIIAISVIVKPNLFIAWINRILLRMQHEPLKIIPLSFNMFYLSGIYFIAWAIYGVSGLILTYTLGIPTTQSGVVIASMFVVSWLVGFISVITPGGVGVREATLVLLLQNSMDAAQALSIAILARAIWTIIELVGAGIGFLIGNIVVSYKKKEIG